MSFSKSVCPPTRVGSTKNRTFLIGVGEETKTLINGEQLNAGFYTGKYAWDCTDNKGQQASNGIYFYKLISGDFTATKKLTVLR